MMVVIIINVNYRELLNDANFHAAVKRVVDEPVPYFSQFSSRSDRQSDSVQQSAHRHIYAAGLEEIPAEQSTNGGAPHPLPGTPTPSHTPQPSQSQCLMQSSVGGELDGGEIFGAALSQSHFEGQPSHVSLVDETKVDTTEMNLRIKQ